MIYQVTKLNIKMNNLIIIIALIVLLLCIGLVAFMVWTFSKTMEKSSELMVKNSEIMKARSYDEYVKIKDNKPLDQNEIKDDPNFQQLSEDNPIPFSDIAGVQINNEPKREIKIYQ